jgi:hypothetical protein
MLKANWSILQLKLHCRTYALLVRAATNRPKSIIRRQCPALIMVSESCWTRSKQHSGNPVFFWEKLVLLSFISTLFLKELKSIEVISIIGIILINCEKI